MPGKRGSPIYRKIYETLLGEIGQGLYSEVGRLPSEKELCQRFDVERNTVRKALQLLVDDLLVIRVPGYGTKLVDDQMAAELNRSAAAARQNILLIAQEDYLKSADGEHFHLRLIQSFERLFSARGYNLFIRTLGREDDFAAVVKDMAPAALVFDSYHPGERYREAAGFGIPCVSVNHYTPAVTSVVSNNFNGASQVARLLVKAGHRRIAVVTGKRDYQTSMERLSGVQSYLQAHGIPLQERYIFKGNWQLQSGAAAAEAILAMPPEERPTAVFAFNDDMAFGCLAGLERGGLSVPGDISLVGFDNTERYRALIRPITTVDVNVDAIVEYTCWVIFGRLEGTAPMARAKIHIDVDIVDNGTVGKPAGDDQQE